MSFSFQEGTCFEINALQRYQFSFSLMSNVEISHTVTNKISFLICIHINNSGFLNINVRKILLLLSVAFWNFIRTVTAHFLETSNFYLLNQM